MYADDGALDDPYGDAREAAELLQRLVRAGGA
jgi:hypothetical protein